MPSRTAVGVSLQALGAVGVTTTPRRRRTRRRAEPARVDRAYRDYFRAASRSDTDFERRTASSFPNVAQAIAGADALLRVEGQSLRADAVQLLRINLIEMVVAPIYSVAPDELRTVLGDFQSDVGRIALAAGRISEGPEVSGHAVIDAVSRQWSNLRMMRPDVWG